MEHLFVADTNLFFECKKLEDLPWSDLGVDPIVIALTKPVQAEIDKHKKGGGRTRKRALEVFSRIRGMLENGVRETVIQEADPQVILRLVPAVLPDPDRSEVLDYTVNDDRIVGIVSALEKQGTSASVVMLTDDSGAAATSESLGLNFRLIDESWKRPPQMSDEIREIADLKKDLAAYRAQEPKIELCDVSEEGHLKHVIRRVPVPLGAEEADLLVSDLQARYPMKTEFSVPDSELWEDGTEVTFEGPDTETVEKYQSEDYPRWVARCRAVLTNLHEDQSVIELPITLSLGLKNTGTRPASQLRITFEALGGIFFRRTSQDDAVEDEDDAGNNSKFIPNLPPPPPTPAAKRHISKPPVKSKGLNLTALERLHSQGIFGDPLKKSYLDTVMRDTNLARLALGNIGHTGMLDGLRRHSDVSNFTIRHEPLMAERLLNLSAIPSKHDPEGFYFSSWPVNQLIKEGGLTCDLFRHQSVEEVFEVEIVFDGDGDASGAVRCRIQAENLTEPVVLTIPVSRKIENFSLSQLASELTSKV